MHHVHVTRQTNDPHIEPIRARDRLESKITEGERLPLADGPAWESLAGREDLEKYGDSNSILLFVAELRLGVEDIDTFAADALTDHGNDKKCDLVSVDSETGLVVVAQSYAAKLPNNKTEAPAGKTSDLNTAVSWLLTGPVTEMPETLRGAAEQTRFALKEGKITDFEIWSVHNCPESVNVSRELKQVESTAHDLIAKNFPACMINVSSAEIGRNRLNDLYSRHSKSIVVSEKIVLDIDGGFEVEGNTWRSFNTTIQLSALRDLWSEHSTDLLSPNVRDYLGIRKSERNINYGIKRTAKDQPEDFFIFNNGITAMVNDFYVSDDSKKLTIDGLGIVNGGQTTGAIGTLSLAEAGGLDRAKVLFRVVKTKTTQVMESVVRFNNTQNRVEAADFRSSDPVQERLRAEFEDIPGAQYRGGRRGGSTNAIRRDRDLLADNTVAQALASFHGDPNLAYNETRRIWDEDAVYARYFSDRTRAKHIIFCYSLLKAIEQYKRELNGIPEQDRTKAQSATVRFLRSRGSSLLFEAALGKCIESVLARAVPDLFRLEFSGNISSSSGVGSWHPLVVSLSAFNEQLTNAANQGLKSQSKVDTALRQFSSMIEAVKSPLALEFETFAKSVILT